MSRRVSFLGLVALLLCVSPAAADETVKGYAEFRRSNELIVEGLVVRAQPTTRYKGPDITGLDSIALGYEVTAKGERQDDGSVLAREIEAKPNGNAMFETEVLRASDEIEQIWVSQGRMFEPDENGEVTEDIGRIVRTGPRAERVERIMRSLTPPYLDYDQRVRVYLIETEEWNAAAMGNGAIWVYNGLIDNLSDGELAIVLGHELAHFTHEHSRRQAKSSLWQTLLGVGLIVAGEALENDVASAAATVAGLLGMTVWSSGYSRGLEDQADRVGLRYASEAGYDVRAGIRLWTKFRDKYGEPDKITNFFVGSHSRASDRISNIEWEIQRNYRNARPTRPDNPPPPPPPGDPAGGTSAPATLASDTNVWRQQVLDQLEAFRREVGEGFEPVGDPVIDVLEPRDETTFDLSVMRGQEYLVVGFCDADCNDLDLLAHDADGENIDLDIEPDDYPVLRFDAPRAATLRITVSMPGCGAGDCVYGVQVYAR